MVWTSGFVWQRPFGAFLDASFKPPPPPEMVVFPLVPLKKAETGTPSKKTHPDGEEHPAKQPFEGSWLDARQYVSNPFVCKATCCCLL